jgi:ABC-type nitrate/sulfonate/bicarbonate transport system permease component
MAQFVMASSGRKVLTSHSSGPLRCSGRLIPALGSSDKGIFEMTKSSLSLVLFGVALACSVAALIGFIIQFLLTGNAHWFFALAPLINAVCLIKLISSQVVRDSTNRKSA